MTTKFPLFGAAFLLFAATGSFAADPLPPLRADGRYSVKEGQGNQTYQVTLSRAYRLKSEAAGPEIVTFPAMRNATELQAYLEGLQSSSGVTHEMCVSRYDSSGSLIVRIVRRKVLAMIPTSVDINPIQAKFGALSAERTSYSSNLVVFTFAGMSDGLRSADMIASEPGVIWAAPIMRALAVPMFHPNDRFYEDYQWHLRNTGQRGPIPGVDIDVEPVWDTKQGDGINVVVVDDGLESLHEDLRSNTSSFGGYDFVDDESDTTDGEHGTAVAGIIGARGNNAIGVSGVAPRCRMVGARVLGGGGADDEEFARAMAYNRTFHVSNNSWGYILPYYDLTDNPILLAIEDVAKFNRGGKGGIICKSSGNDGPADDGNYEMLQTNPYVVSVAATTIVATQASYSEAGACLEVGAPSGDTPLPGISTTDRSAGLGYNPPGPSAIANTNYYSEFDGTSAAAPVVSGVVALMLQRNPLLGYRDVQEILIRSARDYIAAPDWQYKTVLGIDFHFSHLCGGGQVDANAAVTLSGAWSNLKPALLRTMNDDGKELGIPEHPILGVTKTIRSQNAPRVRVEHVLVDVTVDHPRPGELDVFLISPLGTVSILQESRGMVQGVDFGTSRPAKWTYESNFNWGECQGGDWQVFVRDPVVNGRAGTLQNVVINISGGPGPIPTAPPTILSGDMPDGFQLCRYYNNYRIDATGCPLSYSATGLPHGLSVDPVTGDIRGYISEEGDFVVTIKATNEKGTTSLDVNIHVWPWIPTPAISGSPVTLATEGQPFVCNIFVDDPVPANQFLADNLPSGLILDPFTGIISGTPDPGTAGDYYNIITVSNYCGSDATTIPADPPTVSAGEPYFVIVVQPAGRSLVQALDMDPATFTFQVDGVDSWFWGNAESFSGGDAAYSPIFSPDNVAGMSTTIPGPTFVDFEWKISSLSGGDFVRVFVDATEQASISGNVPWTHQQILVPAGNHTVRWEYDNADLNWAGADRAIVDNVIITAPFAASFEAFRAAAFSPDQMLDDTITGADSDPDKDGKSNLVEYALSTSPTNGADGSGDPVVSIKDGQFCFTYVTDMFHTDITIQPESSINGLDWEDVDSQHVSTTGTLESYCVVESMTPGGKKFFRLRITRE